MFSCGPDQSDKCDIFNLINCRSYSVCCVSENCSYGYNLIPIMMQSMAIINSNEKWVTPIIRITDKVTVSDWLDDGQCPCRHIWVGVFLTESEST